MALLRATFSIFLCFFPSLGMAASVEYIDDQAFSRQLTEATIKLKNEGKLLDSKTLIKTMKKGKAKVFPFPVPDSKDPAIISYDELKKKVLVHCSLTKCSGKANFRVGFSSSYAISKDVVVLNHHALADEKKFHAIADSSGRLFPLSEIFAVDEENDIVIARVADGDFSPFPIVPDEPIGNQVIVMSHPDEHFYVMTRGTIARYCVCQCGCDFHKKRSGKWFGMSITADYAKGSSGAPVLNMNGEVVGMVASTNSIYHDESNDQQKNLQMVMKNCVPSRYILNIINKGP